MTRDAGPTTLDQDRALVDHAAPSSTVVDASTAQLATDILAGAFYRDPLWGWAFPDDARRFEQHRAVWGTFVDAAIRYPWVRMNESGTAVALWIPPGGSELTDEGEAAFEPLIVSMLGDDAPLVIDAFAALEHAHPHDEPHFYLSLLGTDPQHLGRGYGLGLLEDNLREIDALGMPAYLESSNPGNVALYVRHGFEPRAAVSIPHGGPDIVTMWRPSRPTPQSV